MKTPIKLHIPSDNVKSMTKFTVNSDADVRALENMGIIFDQGNVDAMSMAMDSALVAPLSTPSNTTPIQKLQAWLPGFVQVITRARKIDELVGITTIGKWSDEEIVQGYAERTGGSGLYNDHTNIPLSSWNTNFETRRIVRFEEGIKVGRLEEERASAINFNSASEKRLAATNALEIQRNYVGFFGFNDGAGRTYGFLNDPSLPAYVTVAQGASNTTQWKDKTALEIIADCITAMQSLRTRSGDLIDPKETKITIAISMSAIDYLSTPTQFGYSAQEWFSKNYPNVKFKSAPELDSANGGSNVMIVYAESYGDGSTDNGATFMQMVPAKFMTIGVQMQAKGYEEDYANATAGVMCKRPWAVLRYSGV